MTTRPIIFSTAMVQALLAGRKTQTRRLGTSPLRHVEVGDLLWVREAFKLSESDDDYKPSEVSSDRPVDYMAGPVTLPILTGRGRPSIHMPRWASRLTLKVTRVRHDRLLMLTDNDAVAEGIIGDDVITGAHCNGGVHQEVVERRYFNPVRTDDHEGHEHAPDAFAELWNGLHDKPGERWEDNPMIVALTFEVHHCNVDRMVVAP
jgi:hypothetical protein